MEPLCIKDVFCVMSCFFHLLKWNMEGPLWGVEEEEGDEGEAEAEEGEEAQKLSIQKWASEIFETLFLFYFWNS